MTLAVTHVLVPIILLEFLRDSNKKIAKFFSKRHVFLVGVAGLLPDMDLLLFRIAELLGKPVPESEVGHRIMFHNVWIPIALFGFFALFYYVLPRLRKVGNKEKKRFISFGKVFLVIFIGFSIHLLLDAGLTGHVMPFYPVNDYMINFDLIGELEALTGIPSLTILVSMDALLLLFWLWHEEMGGKIRDYF
jgi:membrane-bound metal-dependent hydrolase YbcI (DUF457 family)